MDPREGTIEVGFSSDERFTNPVGQIQGGFVAAMLDDTLGPALVATLAPHQFAPTASLNVQYLAPALPGAFVATGRVVRQGSSLAFLSGELFNAGGSLLATATGTTAIRSLWLSLAAMAFGSLHILVDFGVGLFPLQGRLSTAEGATVVLISLIHAWWAISLAAGAQGNGGGIASAAVLGLGWTLLINGYPIVYCPPSCSEAAPLSDVGHVGTLLFGGVAPAAAIWALWRERPRVGVVMPSGALLLVIATVVALSQAAVEP